MGSKPIAKRKAYASAAMRDRKARILRETRCLIANVGAAFQLNDVADAAGVAINTLYRSYGGREELIAHAILDGFQASVDPGEACPRTLTANLHRLRRTADYFRARRNELAGLISIYFNPSTSSETRALVDAGSRNANRALAQASADGLKGAEPSHLADLLTRWEFATLFDWSINRVSDDDATVELAQGYLKLLSTFSCGEVRERVIGRLTGRISQDTSIGAARQPSIIGVTMGGISATL
jgi:AcrR family transcriptional regulator